MPEADLTASEDDVTEDDDDLDAPPKTLSQRSSQAVQKHSADVRTTTPGENPMIGDMQATEKPKNKGFRIGGKAKQKSAEPVPREAAEPSPVPKYQPGDDLTSSQMVANKVASPKKPKRTFKIGGKGKGGTNSGSQIPEAAQPMADRTRATKSPSLQLPSSPPVVKEKSPNGKEPVREETAEEKAERRRAELKRKTDEAAKKQAQSKKKRRF